MKSSTIVVVIVLLVALTAGYLYWANGSQTLPLGLTGNDAALDAQAFNTSYGWTMIHYADPVMGFGFDYPWGYPIAQNYEPESNGSIVTLFVSRPLKDAEVIVVHAAPDASLSEAVADFEQEYPTSNGKTTLTSVDGASGFLYQVDTPPEDFDGLQPATLHYALVACPAAPPFPARLLTLTARVPIDLAGDLQMTNAMAHSLRCLDSGAGA